MQTFGDLLCNASCLRLATLLQTRILHFVAALFTHKPYAWAFRFLPNLCMAQLESLKLCKALLWNSL